MSENPTRGEGNHLSIGEVLTALQAEFPDVTISKIRFLESQGLVDPERTPSGYRKFYAVDVARLRWILMEQRDNFLPLKVIKERLEEHDPVAWDVPPALASQPSTQAGADPAPDVESEPAASEPPSEPAEQKVEVGTETEPPSARRRVRDLTLPLVLDGEDAIADDGEPETFDRVALAEAAKVTEAALDELESYGVIKPFYDDGIRSFYDRDALVCVQAAAALAHHGIQPRHLKMYVHFTDREAALFNQVLAPYLRQRNPVSRAKVDSTLLELVTEARALRGALLRRAIDDALGE